jgi:hypothetical protein
VVEHRSWVVAVVAAIGLIEFAIDSKERWWRLILIVVVLGAIAAGLLWVLGAGGGQFQHHVGIGSHVVSVRGPDVPALHRDPPLSAIPTRRSSSLPSPCG